jgi:DNA-directed RNA polymerase subunit F
MLEEKLIEKKPIVLAEVKELLRERAKEGELSYEQQVTLKYADKFAKLSKTKTLKLLEELKKIEGMSEELAVKLTDLMPESLEVLSLVIPKNLEFSEEKKKEILKVIKEFLK